MFIYNRLTELTILQIFPVFMLLLIALVLGIVLLRVKPSFKLIVLSLIIGVLISMISGFVGWGGFSGEGYAERYGWPLQFSYVYRAFNDNNQVESVFPNSFGMDILRFGVNSTIYVLSILNIVWFFKIRREQKNLKVHILLLLTLLALLILSSLSLYNKTLSIVQTNVTKIEDDTEQKFEPRARYLVENKYPELKDFENQTSFAGKEVVTKMSGTSLYLAYVINGSGVRYADATCFSVDENFIIREIGKLKSKSLDSNSVINPITCSTN